ncbi:hypothetical protein BGZ83_002624 [Gryganskiella cystojenkinii]|nr:hypothetical protein BGZ83_002624 [Gryganskiella cystojenkinii]
MAITLIRQQPSSTEAHIRYTQANVALHVTPESKLIQNPGTLYIADECLYFYSTVSQTGFAIPYLSIIIHAIARESHVGPSIYCQLEGSLTAYESSANGSAAAATDKDGDDEAEDMDEDAVLELSFVPADVSSLDTIYENLSYCASLHQDEDAEQDYDMDDDEYFVDDVNDHEGLYADADIQGGYIPKSSSATAIGHSTESSSNGTQNGDDNNAVDQVPAIDLQSGEWYTGNPETDANFQLSEQGQVMLQQWNTRAAAVAKEQSAQAGKREREEEDQNMDAEAPSVSADANEEYTEEENQEARSKMWRIY